MHFAYLQIPAQRRESHVGEADFCEENMTRLGSTWFKSLIVEMFYSCSSKS